MGLGLPRSPSQRFTQRCKTALRTPKRILCPPSCLPSSTRFRSISDLTNHGIQPEWLFINSNVWNNLSQDQKDAVTKAFATMQAAQRKATDAAAKKDIAELKEKRDASG